MATALAQERRIRGDLTGVAVVILAFVAMVAVTWLDLTDGHLGAAFSVGFILTALTAPMAVDRRSLVTTGALPPILLVVCLFAVSLISPDAIAVSGLAPGSGVMARTLAATLDHGLVLAIGHGLALAAIWLRSAWGVRAAGLREAAA